jgi:hypothetical protein
MPSVFVVPCGGLITAMRPMSVVSHLTFRDRRALRVRVSRVHVWMLRRPAVRVGGSAMFANCMTSVRRWLDVIVASGTLRVMSM